MAILDIKNITKTFLTGNIETTALNDVSLSVYAGDFLALMGPSGCGKSTMLNILGLLDQPQSGSVSYDGKNMAVASRKARSDYRCKNIGFIFQGFNLIDEMTVLENVALPMKYQGMGRAEREDKARNSLDRVGIGHRAGHNPSKLSGGQQQRAAIARAVASRPKIVLADEPTGNLDSKTGESIMSLLCELVEHGTTLVMVTHSDRDSTYASRTIRMLDGRISSDQ